MNYKERVTELRKKGILSDDQAHRLANSLEKSPIDTPSPKKRYWLESVGIVLLLGVTFYLFIVIGVTEPSTEVEDVATTLNSTTTAGIGVIDSFMVILILITIILYGTLYLYAHNHFKAFVRRAEEMVALKESLHHLDVMIDTLKPRLEKLLDAEGTALSEVTKVYAVETLKELEERRFMQQEALALLEAKQRQKKEHFPDNLAGLVGELSKY